MRWWQSVFLFVSHSMVAGGQRDSGTDLVETVVGSSVFPKFHAHDAMHAMTRSGWWGVGGCGRAPYDYSKDSRNTEPLAPGLTDFPIVARSLSRSDEPSPSAPSTASIHIPRHSLDDDEASMRSEPGEESAFKGNLLDVPTAPCGSVR